MLSSQLALLHTEKAELSQSLSALEAELALKGEELHTLQSHLAAERESRVKTAEALQNQLNEKVPDLTYDRVRLRSNGRLHLNRCPQESREQALESQVEEARWSCLRGAVEEAQEMVQAALAHIDHPGDISCTSPAGENLREVSSVLLGRPFTCPSSLQTTWRLAARHRWTPWSGSTPAGTPSWLTAQVGPGLAGTGCLDRTWTGAGAGTGRGPGLRLRRGQERGRGRPAVSGPSSVPAGFPELVRAVFQCGHVISDTMVQGSATSHMVLEEKGEGK